MKKNNLFLSIFIVLILILLCGFLTLHYSSQSSSMQNTSIIGNQTILTKIDSLLLPVYYKNITSADLNVLKNMVKNDDYASGEVDELILLTKYQEYTHIGHGLGFVYQYVKTGKIPICPGHSLAHYYVFTKHGETITAANNLAEAKEKYPTWQSSEQMHNQSYLTEINYTYYDGLINSSIIRIDNGNDTASNDEISTLSEAPCV